MSFAWEVTEEDVASVLARNGLNLDAGEVFEEHFDGYAERLARVERAALTSTDFDEQCAFALDEIEAILIEAGVIARRNP